MRRRSAASFALAFTLCGLPVSAQAPPVLAGVWALYRGGRGADPKLASPPATPLALKPEYAKPYEARRAAEAEQPPKASRWRAAQSRASRTACRP